MGAGHDAGGHGREREIFADDCLHGTASHKRAVRQFRRAKRNEALKAENDRYERRRVVWHMDEDGCWVMHGRFTPEQSERVMKAYCPVFRYYYC